MLKVGMFCIVSVLIGGAYYLLCGDPDAATVVGLLAGCGGAFYVEIAPHLGRRK